MLLHSMLIIQTSHQHHNSIIVFALKQSYWVFLWSWPGTATQSPHAEYGQQITQNHRTSSPGGAWQQNMLDRRITFRVNKKSDKSQQIPVCIYSALTSNTCLLVSSDLCATPLSTNPPITTERRAHCFTDDWPLFMTFLHASKGK